MSEIVVEAKTQVITVEPQSQEINVNPLTGTAVVVGSPTNAISIVNAGPIGPQGVPGLNGDLDALTLLAEVDTKIATHDQASPVHNNATSGRDFAALFQNGLI